MEVRKDEAVDVKTDVNAARSMCKSCTTASK
jgi:hypothetical protein